jgi:hypothetical protein
VDRRRAVGLLLIVISAAGFGSGTVLSKPIYATGLDWLQLLAWRFTIGAALAWAWLLVSPTRRASVRRLGRRPALVAIGLGVWYTGNAGTYYAGLETVPASLAGVLVYLYPAIVAVLSVRFATRLSGRRPWFALGIALVGVILALGGMDWDPTQTKVINGITFVRAASGHISFNPYASCDFGDHCIIREIATHELGHALGLGHTQVADATMFGIAHFDGRCASIHQDDIDAITFVYPATGGGPGPLTILSTSPLGIATAGSAFSRQLLASGGANPYSWSLVSGSLPGGLNLLPNGLISGTPPDTGTSDFTVKVTDPQGVSVQKGLSILVIAPASGFDSQFVSQEVPAALNPGQTFFITIRWINTGAKTWYGDAGFSVVSQNPLNNATWGGNTVPWFGLPVNPGEQLELLFQAFAPSRAGIYDFQWQLYQQGAGVFGQTSANIRITVGDPGPPPDPARGRRGGPCLRADDRSRACAWSRRRRLRPARWWVRRSVSSAPRSSRSSRQSWAIP